MGGPRYLGGVSEECEHRARFEPAPDIPGGEP